MANPTSTPPPLHLTLERDAAQRFGVSRTRLRELRRQHLTSDGDWTQHNGAVTLTAAGVAKIEAVLSGAPLTRNDAQRPAGLSGAPAAAVLAALPPAPPTTQRFVVVRIPVYRVDAPQKKLLIAQVVPADFAPCTPFELAKRLKAARQVAGPEKAAGNRERPVRVRDNTHFRPGMVFDAHAVGLGMWQFLGRLPRRPGKW